MFLEHIYVNTYILNVADQITVYIIIDSLLFIQIEKLCTHPSIKARII